MSKLLRLSEPPPLLNVVLGGCGRVGQESTHGGLLSRGQGPRGITCGRGEILRGAVNRLVLGATGGSSQLGPARRPPCLSDGPGAPLGGRLPVGVRAADSARWPGASGMVRPREGAPGATQPRADPGPAEDAPETRPNCIPRQGVPREARGQFGRGESHISPGPVWPSGKP